MTIEPLGDVALLVHLEGKPPEKLRQLRERLEGARLPGLIECVPAMESLGLFFAPAAAVHLGEMEALVREILEQPAQRAASPKKVRQVEVAVCYAEEFAPDLALVAQRAGLSAEEVIRRHREADYVVACVGFLPGFAYLSGLPEELATPRRAEPRKEVPAGAVAIGGTQTGIYPSRSPGGWNLIGRSPHRMFDPAATPPAFLQTGDRVRFRAISREEYDAIAR